MTEEYNRDRALALMSYDKCFLTKEMANGVADDMRSLLNDILRLRVALQAICDEYEGSGQAAFTIADKALYPGNYLADVITLPE